MRSYFTITKAAANTADNTVLSSLNTITPCGITHTCRAMARRSKQPSSMCLAALELWKQKRYAYIQLYTHIISIIPKYYIYVCSCIFTILTVLVDDLKLFV
jgi:hypothetical protein